MNSSPPRNVTLAAYHLLISSFHPQSSHPPCTQPNLLPTTASPQSPTPSISPAPPNRSERHKSPPKTPCHKRPPPSHVANPPNSSPKHDYLQPSTSTDQHPQ